MRLIDADALPRHGRRGGLVHWKDIADAPTIEPKHGEWIISYTDGIKQTECSECGESFTTYDVYGWGYCPWCGAKMGGEREGE